jgi:hypothetical protein
MVRNWTVIKHILLSIALLLLSSHAHAESSSFGNCVLTDTPRPTESDTVHNGQLMVSSRPSDADVYLDNRMVGRTPVTLPDIRAGIHTLGVKKKGFCDFFDTLNVEPGATILRDAPLDSACGISIQSSPPGAAVFVENIYAGATPLKIPARRAGWITVKLAKRDFALYEENVRLEPGKTIELVAHLESRYGTVTLETFSDNYEVLIDGKKTGVGSIREQMIPAGMHDFVVRRLDRADSLQQTVFIGAGESVRWGARFDLFTTKYVLTSMLLPGLGQINSGATTKGSIFLTSFAASTVTAVIMGVVYSSKLDDYNKAYDNYGTITTIAAANAAGKDLISRHDELNTFYTLRSIAIGATVSIYVVSLVDALLFCTRENVLMPLSSNGVGLRAPELTLSPRGAKCTIQFSF